MKFMQTRNIFILIVVMLIVGIFPSLAFSLPPLKVVQLGDSYSAGNGARSASGERNYVGVKGCYRSPTNWGNQFVNSLKDVFSVTYINKACSGGVVDDILGSRTLETIDMPIFVDGCPSPDYPDEEFYQRIFLGTPQCVRKLRPQIDAIDDSVDLVLMTGGGNDIKFAEIVKQCFATGFRDPDTCQEKVEFADNELDNVKIELIETFAALRGKLRDDARIAFVTYPHLVPDVDYQLKKWFSDPYKAGDAIRALAEKGDRIQREAVEAANAAAGENFIVFYDGTKELFEGHLPNPFQSQPRNPDRWLHEFENVFYLMESYHYNALGHQNLGDALSVFETFGATSDVLDSSVDVDVAFIVDTTGSMGGEIAQVRANIADLVNQLAEDTNSFRVAIVSYRDFSSRTGWSGDYQSRIDQTFTNNLAAIQAAINSLTAQGGGDWPETVFSGIKAAIDLSWRPGVKKLAIVIGDAPALSPEPISGLTSAQVVADSIAVDPVQVFGVNVGSLDYNGALSAITSGTGGEILNGISDLSATISTVLTTAAIQPYAWIGSAYSGKIGEAITFDASGSYDPTGSPLILYEWDFDADGVFEHQSLEPTATHTYNSEFNDFVVVRVTGSEGTALASARVVVNTQGYASMGDNESCELDENGYSIFIDEDGRYIPCTADSLPTVDKEGVTESYGVSGDLNNDGIVDRNDVSIINTHRNQPASTCPDCDIDGDGTITVLDARKLMTMCTYPRCASGI